MIYSSWEKETDLKERLQEIKYKEGVEKSGIPVIYDKDTVYTTKGNDHSMIIGATGSGKTQTIVLPLAKLSMLAGESIIINDTKSEIYEQTANEFSNRGYNIIVIDFDETKYGNYYNPLSLAKRLYDEKNIDKCVTILEDLGYYLFSSTSHESDPFWTNSASDYFTGLSLYLLEKNKEEVTLKNVFDLANKLLDDKDCEEFLKEIGKDTPVFYSVSGTLTSPRETRGGIVSVFNQKLKRYVSRENLSNMMSKTDFDMSSISNKKTAIFIKTGYNDYSSNLVSLFINQAFEAINIYGEKNKKINIIIDEFDSLYPIKNFTEIINYSRSIGMIFTFLIQGIVNLENVYGREKLAIIRLCIANIVYLYSSDLKTLDKISELCGNESEKKPLISVEELKKMEPCEAVFLIPRVLPFKNKLVPDYKIDWGIEFKKEELLLRK